MDIIFIGQFVSLKESLTNINYSQASNLYHIKFLKLIKPKLAISIIPFFINKNHNFKLPDHSVNFINNPIPKVNIYYKIKRLLKDTHQTLRLINKSNIKDIWLYNITIANLLIVFYLLLFTRKRLFVLVADYSFSKTNIVTLLVNIAIKHCHGTIVWNSKIPHKNRLILPDILDSEVIKLNTSSKIKPLILFSGSLGKTTGFEFALEFFSKYQDYELIITGKPYHYSEAEFNKLISDYVTPNDNIKYYGLLDLKKYYEVLTKVDIALSLRDPLVTQHDGNFPSKILEYLSFGKFVVSTKKYSDIDSQIYFYSEPDFISLNNTLSEILKLKSKDLLSLRKYIYDNLLENHTEKNLKKAIQLISKK